MAESALLTKRTRSTEPATPSAILIIDDNPEIRESLQTLLEIEGYQSDSADTADSGLALLANSVYDLVLLDIGLPDRSGLEVLEEIRDRDPHLPVIMITAQGTVENAVRAMSNGATPALASWPIPNTW